LVTERKFPRPGIKAEPPANEPRLGKDPAVIRQRKPIWRTSMMDLNGRWGFSRCDLQGFLQIQGKMAALETMTWGEIEEKTKSVGGIPLENPKFHPYVNVRLHQLGINDVDNLYHLRVTKRGRLWGIRIAEEFYLLWWDRNHDVFRSKAWHP
jgi:hypothetical protein